VTRFPPRHDTHRALLVAAVLLARGAAADAQSGAAVGISAGQTFRLAADEQTLWLVQSDGARSVLQVRGPDSPFSPRPPLHGSIAELAVARTDLYVFLEDGDFYAFRQNAWTAELNLPGRVVPVDLLGTNNELYALVPAAGGDPSDPRAETAPPDRPQGRLVVARYDPRGWTTLTAAPVGSDGEPDRRLRPRLGVAQGFLHVVWFDRDRAQIRSARWDSQAAHWQPGPSLSVPPDVSAFWVTAVSRVPSIFVARRAADGTEELHAWRLLGDLQTGSAEWRSAAVTLSALPDDARPVAYLAASGFNQHVALLVSTTGGAWVRFGRSEGQPAESSRAVASIFQQRHGPGTAARWLQTGTLLVLTATLLTLFVFRRGSLAQSLNLPVEWTLAFAFQRLAGCLLDLLPFALGSAALLGVDARAGVRELFTWAVGPDAGARRLPGQETLVWWAVATGSCSLYALVLELLARRTVAKLILGTHVLAENGGRPRVHQIVVRNLIRFLELQPPLWILGFLVLLSRNRQRLGDIFAGTVVVRRVRASTTPPPNGE